MMEQELSQAIGSVAWTGLLQAESAEDNPSFDGHKQHVVFGLSQWLRSNTSRVVTSEAVKEITRRDAAFYELKEKIARTDFPQRRELRALITAWVERWFPVTEAA